MIIKFDIHQFYQVTSCTESRFNKKGTPLSYYKGVTFFRYIFQQERPFLKLTWRARIALKGKRIDLGVFDSEVAAAEAYHRAAQEANSSKPSKQKRLNFPKKPERSRYKFQAKS